MSCFPQIGEKNGRHRFERSAAGIVAAVADFPLCREAWIRLHIGKKKVCRYVRCHFKNSGEG